MLRSIGKLSKSFAIKLLVGIIILPFVFWGMGDIFRGGNQNIVASIDNKKISSQEFVNYLNRINLDKTILDDISKTDIIQKVLAEYIGKKIILLEIKDLGIKLSDSSLKNIIINDKAFFKDDKFSRTSYEKFLIESGMSAPSFEQNISNEEKKRQLLNHLSQGINVPDFLVLSEYYKENQIKEIKYLDLNNFYKNIKIENKETEELFKKNKNFFVEKVKSINLTELKPINLIGKNEYNEDYFKKIDILENRILDGETLNNIQKEYNLQIKKISNIGNKIIKENTNGVDIELVKKIYSLKILKKPSLINHNNKYYLGEISSITNKEKSINDPEVKSLLKKQIQLKNKIINNNEIAKNISLRKFYKNEFQNFASDNSLQINSIKLENIGKNKIFSESLIRRIFETNDGEFKLISNSTLDKNFIIFSEKTQRNPIKPDNEIYKEYLQKAKFNLTREIYEIYDKSINTKYNVVTNKKVIDRIKNSF
tara:strand:+ start:783 stop:2228 length:1446 start_codon:yes stop_codon:yes gene_type:complete